MKAMNIFTRSETGWVVDVEALAKTKWAASPNVAKALAFLNEVWSEVEARHEDARAFQRAVLDADEDGAAREALARSDEAEQAVRVEPDPDKAALAALASQEARQEAERIIRQVRETATLTDEARFASYGRGWTKGGPVLAEKALRAGAVTVVATHDTEEWEGELAFNKASERITGPSEVFELLRWVAAPSAYEQEQW